MKNFDGAYAGGGAAVCRRTGFRPPDVRLESGLENGP
jgi:hypothetical protein